MHFLDFDAATFLRDYWQKQPLVIRNPWDAWHNPLEPDDLAGLACEDEIESRLITLARQPWQLEHGPFPPKRLGKLGRQPWTLLVQAVDHYVPEVAALIEPFRFVPDWRIDDVMVSIASDQGGVGPHFDQYDVFLIQGMGRRRWQVGQFCDADTPLAPHDDLRLLADFTVTGEWILEPGDILYVPPRMAHDGVALGDDCMTYSIGFRAPSRSELIAHWCDDRLENLTDQDRYTDPDAAPAQANPGEITPDALDRLQAMVTRTLDDKAAFSRWFGRFTTTRKYPDVDWSPEDPVTPAELGERLASGTPLQRNAASRFSFVRQSPLPESGGHVLLFVDGECHECTGETAALAQQLCAETLLYLDEARLPAEPGLALLAALVNQGSLNCDPDQAD